MTAAVTDLVTVLAVVAIAALGGAFAVYAGYDDSPGGVLLGLVLIMGAAALGVRAVGRRTNHRGSGSGS